MNVAVIGTGYVGLTTGVSLAYLGNRVVCVDIDRTKVENLKNGIIPIYEPGLSELLDLSMGNIFFTTEYQEGVKNADVIFIAVGTPSNKDGSPCLQYVSDAAKQIGMNICGEDIVVVNKSTVPIGSGNWVEALICDAYKEENPEKGKCKVHVVSNPEFLKEGTAIYDTFYPDRIVIGGDNDFAKNRIMELYTPIINQDFKALPFLKSPGAYGKVPVVLTNLASAELIKYSANAFLALKISFINEMAAISEKVGADILQIVQGIGLDQRIGPKFLNAGIGWGGSCFGKDTAAIVSIAEDYRLDTSIIQAARKVNYELRDKAVEKLQDELKILKGKTISLLGLSFKPNTDDLRDSPAIDIARKLIKRGAKVKAFDPVSIERAKKELADLEVIYVDSYTALFEGSDSVVLATEWPEFKNIEWAELIKYMRNPFVFDGRNILDTDELTNMGYKVKGVGR